MRNAEFLIPTNCSYAITIGVVGGVVVCYYSHHRHCHHHLYS